MAATIYRTGKKGLQMRAAENQAQNPTPSAAGATVISPPSIPLPTIAAMFGLVALVTVHAAVVGGKSAKQSLLGIGRCSAGYWTLYLALFLALSATTFLVAKRRTAADAQNAGALDPETPTARSSGLISAGAFGAGIVASALGIGGACRTLPQDMR